MTFQQEALRRWPDSNFDVPVDLAGAAKTFFLGSPTPGLIVAGAHTPRNPAKSGSNETFQTQEPCLRGSSTQAHTRAGTRPLALAASRPAAVGRSTLSLNGTA